MGPFSGMKYKVAKFRAYTLEEVHEKRFFDNIDPVEVTSDFLTYTEAVSIAEEYNTNRTRNTDYFYWVQAYF